MSTIDKAIILAAGRGQRMASGLQGRPKPLLPLDGAEGPCFLDWHLQALEAIGVREIYLVGNHVTFEAPLRGPSKAHVRWILNPTEDLSTSGSAHSAYFAFESSHRILDGASRVLLMDADIVYDGALLDKLAHAQEDASKLLVCSEYRSTQEEVLVFEDAHKPPQLRYQGKGLAETPLVQGCRCLGEATGILLWEPQDHERVRAITAWLMRYSSAKERSEHEDITQRMMMLGRMEAFCFDKEHLFMEVDTPEEYRTLVQKVYPALVAHDRRRN